MMLLLALCGRMSRSFHLPVSRYVPTVTRLRPGTRNVFPPEAMTYENGMSDVSGWLSIFPMHMEKAPMVAGISMCAPLAVLAPRSSVP